MHVQVRKHTKSNYVYEYKLLSYRLVHTCSTQSIPSLECVANDTRCRYYYLSLDALTPHSHDIDEIQISAMGTYLPDGEGGALCSPPTSSHIYLAICRFRGCVRDNTTAT